MEEEIQSISEILNMSDDEFMKSRSSLYKEVPKTSSETPIESSQIEEKPKADTTPKVIDKDEAVEFYKAFQEPLLIQGKKINLTDPEAVLDYIYNGVVSTNKLEKLKPVLKAVQSFEKHGIDLAANAGFIIELLKGSSPAIEHLLYKHSLNPIHLDPMRQSSESYKSNISTMSDFAYDFQNFIENLVELENGTEAIQYVNSLSEDSQIKVANQPFILSEIRKAMCMDIHDDIVAELEDKKLRGFNYAIDELSLYLSILQNKIEKTPPKTTLINIESKSTKDPRKSAVSTKTRSRQMEATETLDFLSLSDEDFKNLRHKR